jgi:two-component system NarL family sensor kinase
MLRRLNRIVDYLTAEPVRVSAFLRLPMIGLIVLVAFVGGVQHWLPVVYDAVLDAYTAAALVWLVIVLRRPLPCWGCAWRRALRRHGCCRCCSCCRLAL